jgi:hypothetical protein
MFSIAYDRIETMRLKKEEAICPCDLCREARLRAVSDLEPLPAPSSTVRSAEFPLRAIPPQRETGRLVPRL